MVEHLPHFEAGEHRIEQGKALRYSRFVHISKVFLLLAAIGLLGVVIALPILEGDTEGFRIVFSGESKPTEPQPPRMNHPRFQGADGDGQPYNITADYALQEGPKKLSLHKMQGDVLLKDGSWIAVIAGLAKLDMDGRSAELLEEVEVFHDAGYTFRTREVSLDLKEGIAYGAMPVTMHGPEGTLNAQGFSLAADKGDIYLYGPVKLVLQPPFGE